MADAQMMLRPLLEEYASIQAQMAVIDYIGKRGPTVCQLREKRILFGSEFLQKDFYTY